MSERGIWITTVLCVVAILGAAVYAWKMSQVNHGIIDDKYSEAEARWWTNETECRRWDTDVYPCTSVGANGTVSVSVCTRTVCGHWHPYQQEWIDDEDFVINVLGEDGWGDMKMKRVYLARTTWEGFERGMEWHAIETPDIGDDHRKGERTP